MARSASFSEARIPELAVRLASAPTEQVADAIDVHPTTIRRWLRRGREEPGSIYGRLIEAIDAAGGRGGPLSREELVVLLERQARRGNVRAIQLLLERPWAQGERAEPASGLIDELARRRVQR